MKCAPIQVCHRELMNKDNNRPVPKKKLSHYRREGTFSSVAGRGSTSVLSFSQQPLPGTVPHACTNSEVVILVSCLHGFKQLEK